MLRCVVHTNLPASKLSDSFRTELANSLKQRYGLPSENITVWIRDELRLMRSGTREPCGYLELFGCDNIFADKKNNREDSTALLQLLEDHSGIPLERLFVLMRPQWSTNWGKSGGESLVMDHA